VDALFVSYSGMLGGAERLLLELAAGRSAPTALACPPGPLAEAARERGVRVVSFRPRRLELRASAADRVRAPLRIAGHAAEVRRAVRELRPRVVVACGMRSLLACALAASGGPRLVFLHVDFLPSALVGRAVRAAARSADRIVCPSRAVADELGLESEVVHPGVDLGAFAPGPAPVEPPEALLLGAIVDWKRPGFALEAVARAARAVPGLRLTVAGGPIDADGERLLARLRERAELPDLHGSVTFAGPLDDPRPALAGAWCLLHCAEREPFGIVLIEALASGRPVVAPDFGGPSEIVDRSCGLLYPPNDVAAAADALAALLSDPELTARMGASGRERAGQFGLEAARARFEQILTSV
jgi:glycosyltransferase involved in cell wall biosynthesis